VAGVGRFGPPPDRATSKVWGLPLVDPSHTPLFNSIHFNHSNPLNAIPVPTIYSMTDSDLLRLTPSGLYCERGQFFIDPWGPVAKAVITHAHADHARRGSKEYLTTHSGKPVLQTRMGPSAVIQSVAYGERVLMGEVAVSLHPAGHILGSAQVRVEHRGEVWVVSGDYKVAPDHLVESFELVPCHTFITESTFGLPIYRWRPQAELYAEINAWWRENQQAGRTSLIHGYSLGKAQRILAGLDRDIGPIYCHSTVAVCNRDYAAGGVPLAGWRQLSEAPPRCDWSRAIIIAPPQAHSGETPRHYGETSAAFCSGWMTIRGTRRRESIDRGFPLSDHADWPELTETILATGAERVYVTHGSTATLVRWLTERGRDARPLRTQFGDEETQVEVTEMPHDVAATGV
jgi:putative mRNA 3-end processing factor